MAYNSDGMSAGGGSKGGLYGSPVKKSSPRKWGWMGPPLDGVDSYEKQLSNMGKKQYSLAKGKK